MHRHTYNRALVLGASAALLTAGVSAPAAAAPDDRGRGAEKSAHGTSSDRPAKTGRSTQAPDRERAPDRESRPAPARKASTRTPARPAPSPAPSPAPAPKAGKQQPAADRGAKGSPPGNNGSVKIIGAGDADTIPQNHPHVGCDFGVEWYGFEEGADIVSTVSFAMQAPTADVGLTVDGPGQVAVGGDPAGGGTDLDGREPYSLDFDGAPHPQQGYHVKLTISTPRSLGNDTKTKVFWVQGCEDTEVPEEPENPENPENPELPEEPETPVITDEPVLPESPENPDDSTQVSPPAGGDVPEMSLTTTAVQPGTTQEAGVQVPTTVDAGLAPAGASPRGTDALAPALLGLSGLLALAGYALRRRAGADLPA